MSKHATFPVECAKCGNLILTESPHECVKSEAPACRGCRFWRRGWGNTDDGRCHRNPPTIQPDLDENDFPDYTGRFPEVTAGEWCGEFAPRGEDGK